MEKKKVAFICVHNSCRSQIAEALGKKLAGEVFDSYSAGTETKPQINQDAVRLMKQYHGIDMEETQYSKLLDALPPVDVVITMGCGVPGLPVSIGRIGDWKTPPVSQTRFFSTPSDKLKKKFFTSGMRSWRVKYENSPSAESADGLFFIPDPPA